MRRGRGGGMPPFRGGGGIIRNKIIYY